MNWYDRVLNTIIAVALAVMAGVQAAKASERMDREVQCLALNVYHEARGEPLPGQYAVAYVTMERANTKRFGVCRAVYEPSQFSWVANNPPKAHGYAWYRAQQVAKAVYLHDMIGLTPPFSATHYHADYVFPHWYRAMHKVGTIGRHHFYLARL